ncbi:acyl-CoA thioesterase [Olivibacter sitiensis]|uniref:acyl-CoA thioesterase n=1 Tax=Olivibacter sitiensis TaxID=376470 RepID=UPI000400BC0F|nr:acyl-CoA thioesterase [Olivibacter sitiensis]
MKSYSSFRTLMKVRPDDIDMFQHVHNSKYFDYVLAARYEQMRDNYGTTMEDYMERGLGWVIRTAHVTYKRPLKMGQEFYVETGIESIHERGCTVQFKILFKENEKVSCEGWFEYILIETATGKLTKMPEELLEQYAI